MCIKSYVISNENDLVQVLDTMYENSKKDNCEFYDLIELMKNEETIISAIHRIKANKGSYTAGIDNNDINNYLQMKADKLIKLIQDTIDDYHPSPVRRVYIPKKNGKMRPLGYSKDGREIRKQSKTKRQIGKCRNTIYNPYELFRIIGNNERNEKIYNFEYVMNREYAYNSDRGKCVACKNIVYVGNIHCHHKNKKLPMNQINKLYNLTTLCKDCHNLVHSDAITNNKKILELRSILNH